MLRLRRRFMRVLKNMIEHMRMQTYVRIQDARMYAKAKQWQACV